MKNSPVGNHPTERNRNAVWLIERNQLLLDALFSTTYHSEPAPSSLYSRTCCQYPNKITMR